MFGAELAEFVLIIQAAVVFLLAVDVVDDVVAFGLAHGKDAVAGLPMEVAQGRVFGFEPFGRAYFELLDEVGDRGGARELAQDVDVIFDAVDGETRTIERFEDGDGIGVELVADRWVVQKGMAMFRGEDDVNQDVCEGLGHGGVSRRRYGRWRHHNVTAGYRRVPTAVRPFGAYM